MVYRQYGLRLRRRRAEMPYIISDGDGELLQKIAGTAYDLANFAVEEIARDMIQVEAVDAETLLTDEENHEIVWKRADQATGSNG
jgi:hypothetical protein